MRKRILALAMTTAMVLGGTACGGSDAATESASTSQAATEKQNTGESENGDSTHIYVLTAPEDHGWTGSVATFAKEKIEEVNAAGTYTSELITSADASEQIRNIEDILSKGEKNIAIVIQPIDDTVQSAIQQIVDAEIPYVAFDRIIDGVASSAVSNVKGDNEGIGVLRNAAGG